MCLYIISPSQASAEFGSIDNQLPDSDHRHVIGVSRDNHGCGVDTFHQKSRICPPISRGEAGECDDIRSLPKCGWVVVYAIIVKLGSL
jgi:hypothetical protein